MIARRTTVTTPTTTAPSEALVWIDHSQAVIVGHEPDGRQSVEVLGRGPAESEISFDVRTIDEVIDEERVTVSGPAFARTAFERAYVAVTHRPDRIVDVEPRTAPRRRNGRTA